MARLPECIPNPSINAVAVGTWYVHKIVHSEIGVHVWSDLCRVWSDLCNSEIGVQVLSDLCKVLSDLCNSEICVHVWSDLCKVWSDLCNSEIGVHVWSDLCRVWSDLCNSEVGVHVWSDLLMLFDLLRSRAVTNLIFFRKDLFSVQHLLSYHLILVPCCRYKLLFVLRASVFKTKLLYELVGLSVGLSLSL